MKFTNKYVQPDIVPKISIVTPMYNRKHTISRTLASVQEQAYRDFECIIVDDGSTDDPDELIFAFMESIDVPVIYIKKPNGGVHTARNCAIRESRGELMFFLDSDDELTPNALETFVGMWNQIPNDEKGKYREIVAQCMDQNGVRVGPPFPENINDLPVHIAKKACYEARGEHTGILVGDIMRNNLWPEPKGVTFVEEDIIWVRLDAKYSSRYTNEMLRVYHRDGIDHISNSKKATRMTLQAVKNTYFNITYMLNDWNTYRKKYKGKMRFLKQTVFYHVLKQYNEEELIQTWNVHGILRLVQILLYIPAEIAACIYVKKKLR